jgi:small subunit ribosomal protein S1
MNMQTKEETKELEKLYAETLHRVQRGVISKGKVIAVKNDTVVVDIGYKSEGIIPLSEFTEAELLGLKEGDMIEVLVEKINDREGVITVSKDRAAKIRAWEALTDAYNSNSKIVGRVIEKTKGGLIVDVLGVKAFLPASQVDIKIIKSLDSYVGQTVPLRILKLVPPKSHANISANHIAGTSLIVSRRSIVEEERQIKKEETLKVLKEGAILRGMVKNITDYGVFVDIGGIDGLLHISDISWGRVNHPSEFFFYR